MKRTSAEKWTVHQVASRPSHGDQHVDPVNPKKIGKGHGSRIEARVAAITYKARHPKAWVQIQSPSGEAEDV